MQLLPPTELKYQYAYSIGGTSRFLFQKVAQLELVSDVATEVVATASKDAQEISDDHRSRLWELANQTGDHLTLDQKEQLFTLFLEYADLFATGPDDFGQTGRLQHKINTGNAQPIQQQARRIPPFRKEAVKIPLGREMLDKDVIRPSESPWASPVVLMKKKDG